LTLSSPVITLMNTAEPSVLGHSRSISLIRQSEEPEVALQPSVDSDCQTGTVPCDALRRKFSKTISSGPSLSGFTLQDDA